jgi:hypothetical protein
LSKINNCFGAGGTMAALAGGRHGTPACGAGVRDEHGD